MNDEDGCGCRSGMAGRHFLTNQEKIDLLKERKEWMEQEAKGISEVIKELEERGKDAK